MLFVTRLGGLRHINFFFFEGSELAIGSGCCLGDLEVFFKGKRGWGSPAESTRLSTASGCSMEAMAVETLKRGSSGRLPAAPGTVAKQGRCLLFCTLGLFIIFFFISPFSLCSRLRFGLPSCWEEHGGSVSVPRHRPRCRDIHQINPAACSEPVF